MQAARLMSTTMLLACGVTLTFANGSPATPQKPRASLPRQTKSFASKKGAGLRRAFVGDSTCQRCHWEIGKTYARTVHHLTSQLPNKDSIAGKFTNGANILRTSDPDLHFRMDETESGFYETAVFWQPPNEKTRSERIDLVTGSGEKGQTYLYWKGNQLFQLPVSYWTELQQWVNSPGFTDGIADFNRPIVPRCLECHATYFASIASRKAENYYQKTGFVLGISCERCHGPGREHVERESAKSAAVSAAAPTIVNPAALPRDLQMAVCAQCHAGIGENVAPAFSYIPGQSLEKFMQLSRPDPDARVDVHGNQVALMQRSRCYRNSEMTCTTCHELHAPERQAATYSDKCLQCHKDRDCGEFAKLGAKIRDNCIDCHMPVQESDLIISTLQGKQIKARMRNHWIKAYSTPQNP